MSIDTLIVIGTVVPAAAMGAMGFLVTTRPPSEKSKFRYESTFAVLTIASLSFGVWGGIRNNTASSKLEDELGGLQTQMERIAGSQGLSTGLSAKELANAIIGRFDQLQSKVDDAESEIAVIQHPPEDLLKLYQQGIAVASVQDGTIAPDGKSVFFNLLSDTQNMDFDDVFTFRSKKWSCRRQPISAEMEATDHGPLTSTRHDVACVVIGN